MFTELQSAIELNRVLRTWSYLNLATIERGLPRSRTVVFRGLAELQNGTGLCFCTDARSQKVVQRDNKKAEICWYFSVTQQQFRFQGIVEYYNGDSSCTTDIKDLRQSVWKKLSTQSKLSFLTSYSPGDAVNTSTSFVMSDHTADTQDNMSIPDSNNFLLGILWPTSCDMLDLKSNKRVIFSDGMSRFVNP
jgi:hypothetical protein